MNPGAAIVVEVQADAGQVAEPASIVGGRARRCLVFAPTATSALLLALCTFLPFGVYGGCSNSQQVISPYERQAEAIASGDVSDLIVLSIPYAFALVLGLGTLAAVCFRGPRASTGFGHFTPG